MKICVVQPDLSRIGGSLSTIMSFADCFKQLGYEVNVKSSFGDRFPKKLVSSKEEVINHYNYKFLKQSDITWDFERKKIKTDADICFTRGFEATKVFHYKSILWIIIHNEIIRSPNILQYWTNSNTTKNTFKGIEDKTNVIIPPHDYSIFRNNISQNKKYDVVSILRGNDFKLKGLQLYANTIKKLNCKSLLITTFTSEKDLKRIKSLNIPFVVNQSKEQVAEILGQSNIFLFPSYYESCPLVIYEALNSGCTIVSRDVGAVKEQINGLGYLFTDDSECVNLIKYALNHLLKPIDCINRGLEFDRINVIDKIQETLLNIKKELY